MIDINLIPPSSRKQNVKGVLSSFSLGLPQDIFIGVAFGFVVLLVAIHILLCGVWVVQGVFYLTAQSHWNKVLPDKNNLDAIGTEVKDLKKKVDSLKDMSSSKSLGWSRRLNVISDAVPNWLWLRKMTLDAKSLTMEGTVSAKNQNEISIIGGFVEKLKRDSFFMADVSVIEVGTVQRSKRGTTDVANFTVVVKFK